MATSMPRRVACVKREALGGVALVCVLWSLTSGVEHNWEARHSYLRRRRVVSGAKPRAAPVPSGYGPPLRRSRYARRQVKSRPILGAAAATGRMNGRWRRGEAARHIGRRGESDGLHG